MPLLYPVVHEAFLQQMHLFGPFHLNLLVLYFSQLIQKPAFYYQTCVYLSCLAGCCRKKVELQPVACQVDQVWLDCIGRIGQTGSLFWPCYSSPAWSTWRAKVNLMCNRLEKNVTLDLQTEAHNTVSSMKSPQKWQSTFSSPHPVLVLSMGRP